MSARWAAALLACLVLVAGCGSTAKRSQADMDKDGNTLAAALQTADTDGANFTLNEHWVVTGGSVPKGQQISHLLTATGSLKGGRARMTFKITHGTSSASYDLVVADSYLYARPHNKGSWKRTPALAGTALYPATLLGLLRESVLLAKRVDASSVVQVNNGFGRKYVVIPASDQLEQLQAISLTGSDETVFLKSATAEIDVFLTLTGGKLQRLEVHLLGTDPTTGEKNKIDSIADYTLSKVKPINAPTGALDVQPVDIFT